MAVVQDYDRIAAVIRYLQDHCGEQPRLGRLAAAAGLSPWQLQRLFSRWAGLSPKQFLQALTLAHARQLLQRGEGVLETAVAVGLSGPGRLHDLCVHLEAATPGEIKTAGEGWAIRAGHADSPFGLCLIGEGPRGICYLAFCRQADRDAAERAVAAHWPRARLVWDPSRAARLAEGVFAGHPSAGQPLRAYCRGSRFQVRVWRALLEVPAGALTSYGRLAVRIGQPGAARAVGSAVGSNPLAYLIPCHRVVRETGALGGYRWGETRKQALIARETADRHPPD